MTLVVKSIDCGAKLKLSALDYVTSGTLQTLLNIIDSWFANV